MKNKKRQTGDVLKRHLAAVRTRIRVKRMLLQFLRFALIFLAFYAACFLASRLLFIIPDYFNFYSLLIPLLLAALSALFFHKKPDIAECAKDADDAHGTQDLFYTASVISTAHGQYSDLVLDEAYRKAGIIDPAVVVSLPGLRKLLPLLISFLLLLTAIIFLPQFDPFHKSEQKKKRDEMRSKIEKADEAVKKRLAFLKKHTKSDKSPEVEKLLSEIKQEFDAMRKADKTKNRDRIKRIKKALAETWKRREGNKMRDKLSESLTRQSFGIQSEKSRKWAKQVQKKDFSGLKKEISEIQKLASKIVSEKSSAKRAEMRKDLAAKMQELSSFISSKLGSKSASGAIKNAKQQMDLSKMDGLRKKGMDAMQNSMELLNRELDRLQQMNNDISELEAAMEAAQLAKQLNELNQMKNADSQGLTSMQDYEDLYKQMMQQACKNGNGNCSGDGKPGQGQPGKPGGGGGFPEENKDASTKTVKQVSSSKLQSGKILLKWNSKGMGKTGHVDEKYLKTVKKVKQGVSEAIIKEEVPPGYHKTIQKYFDSLDK